jgi:transposase
MAGMRGRPLVVEWHEDAEALRQAYRRERDAERRTRLHALWLIRAGDSARAAARAVGVHEATVAQWLAWYRRGGLAEVGRHRHGGRQGRACWLSAEQRAERAAEAARGHFRTAAQARGWVEQRWGVRYTPKSISTLLRRLTLHPEVPRPQAEKASPQAQARWKGGA